MKHPFPIIEQRLRWYILSLVLIVPGIAAWFAWGLNVGIDFKGGTQLQVEYSGERPEIQQVRESVEAVGVPGVSLQTSGGNQFLIRFPNEDGRSAREDASALVEALTEEAGEGQVVEELSYENIGGSVAATTTRSAFLAVIVASLAIILYIAWSFRGIPQPASSWRFGLATILTLIHDLLFVVGAFAIVGHFFPSVEVDALFITALLTVVGFSVNDTIVVFDRIRENLKTQKGRPFARIANESLNQTLTRSLNTSLTVLMVLVALLLMGGESIRSFILALTLGIAVGTYSSIFNAAPLLVSWQNMIEKKKVNLT